MCVARIWFWVCLKFAILILCLKFNHVSEACQVSLVGSVYCDTCFRQDFSESSHFISGALVAVECGGDGIPASGGEERIFREEVKTDDKGEFKVNLPFLENKDVNEIEGCSVNLISSSEPDCAVAATTTPPSIRLKMKSPDYRVFSAGFFTFQPQNLSDVCHAEIINKELNDDINASTPLQSPVDGKQTTIKLDDLPDINNNFATPNPPEQFMPPSIVPTFQLQPPPNTRFNPGFQPPPPDFVFDPGFQPPPPPGFMFIPGFQPPPPPEFLFNPGSQLPPPPPVVTFNPGSQLPPPAFMLSPMPLQPPPEQPTFDPFQQSPPTLIPQLFTPPPSFPSLPFPPIQPQPNFIQSPPSPQLIPPPQLMPPPPPQPPSPSVPPPGSLPPFPFQPRPGFPRTPPETPSP